MWTRSTVIGSLAMLLISLAGTALAQAPELGLPLSDLAAWRCSQPTTCTREGWFDDRSGIWSVDRDAEQVVTDVRFTTFWLPPEVLRSPIAGVSRRPATDAAAWFDRQVDRLRTQGWSIGAHGSDFAELSRLSTKLEVARWAASLHREFDGQVVTTAVQLRWRHSGP